VPQKVTKRVTKSGKILPLRWRMAQDHKCEERSRSGIVADIHP
jgi:hypothetical protein